MKTPLIVLFGSLTFFATQTAIAGDAKAGKAKAAVCATCHGTNGKATAPMYPNLAGQNEAYLVSALKSYRSNERQGGMSSLMQPQAASLSDDDINNLAAYFAGL